LWALEKLDGHRALSYINLNAIGITGLDEANLLAANEYLHKKCLMNIEKI